MALSKPPLLINILAQETSLEPLRSLMNELQTLDRARDFLDASILAGFPYADVAAAGPSCVVVTNNAPALASETAERLSARIWALRHELTATPPGPEEAVARALAAPARRRRRSCSWTWATTSAAGRPPTAPC